VIIIFLEFFSSHFLKIYVVSIKYKIFLLSNKKFEIRTLPIPKLINILI